MSHRRQPRSASAWTGFAALVWLLVPAPVDAGPGPKEFTPGCVTSPLPTQPRGAVSMREVVDASGTNALRITLWRQPCSGGDAQALLTFTPLRGRPVVESVRVRQDGREDRAPDLIASTAPLTFLFGPLDAAASALLSARMDPPFDDDCAFEVDYVDRDGRVHPVALAAEPGASCSRAYGADGAALSARLGGAWFDPAREGEGVMVDFPLVGDQRIAFLSWYTYESGRPLWLLGNATYAAGDRSVRLAVVRTEGAEFGAAFRPDQVIRRAWGEALLSFPSCDRLRLAWTRADGVTGTLLLRRVGPADGVVCP
jgi:hypothetical protein